MKRVALGVLVATAALLSAPSETESQGLDAQVYELRVYTTNPGLLKHLHDRFANHTNRLFVKHGMRLIGYWVPADEEDKLIYVLAFPSLEARERAWQAFRDDPEWHEVRDASHEAAGGVIVAQVDSTVMFPTDYSPIR